MSVATNDVVLLAKDATAGSTPLFATHGLTKTFGARTAVDKVDLTVPAGCAFGFLGPNGAGKTTVIRMLVGLLKASGGDMRVLGMEVPAVCVPESLLRQVAKPNHERERRFFDVFVQKSCRIGECFLGDVRGVNARR